MRGGISNEGRAFCSIEDGESLTHSSSLLTDPFNHFGPTLTWNQARHGTRLMA